MYSFLTRVICVILYDTQEQTLENMTLNKMHPLDCCNFYLTPVQTDWKQVALIFYENLNKFNNRATHPNELVASPTLETLTEAILSKNMEVSTELCTKLVHTTYLKYGTSNDFGFHLIYTYRSLLSRLYPADEQTLENLQQSLDVNFSIPYRGDEITALNDFLEGIKKFMDYVSQNLQNKNGRVIQLVKRYINENFQKDISLEEIAEQIGLSKFYLSRTFKQIEKDNLKNYILNVRIEKAKQFLLSGDNATESAYKSGFNDSAYFSKCFKRLTGQSPTQFQKKQ